MDDLAAAPPRTRHIEARRARARARALTVPRRAAVQLSADNHNAYCIHWHHQLYEIIFTLNLDTIQRKYEINCIYYNIHPVSNIDIFY